MFKNFLFLFFVRFHVPFYLYWYKLDPTDLYSTIAWLLTTWKQRPGIRNNGTMLFQECLAASAWWSTPRRWELKTAPILKGHRRRWWCGNPRWLPRDLEQFRWCQRVINQRAQLTRPKIYFQVYLRGNIQKLRVPSLARFLHSNRLEVAIFLDHDPAQI